jgi:hypothetical protein
MHRSYDPTIINLSLFDIFRRTSPLYVYLVGPRQT